MATRNERLVPFKATHPGEILREELLERGIKQKDFAEQIGMQPTHLNAFIKGKRNMNEELAIKLEKHLGIPYNVWMNLHNSYLYDTKAIEERKTEEQEAMEFETACSEIFNLRYLYKRLDLALLVCVERVRRLKELFDFDLRSAKDLQLQVAGMYKHSEKVQIDEKNMLTWLILNTLEISKISSPVPYQKGSALHAASIIAQEANNRTLSVVGIRECLNKHGISFLEVPKIEKAPIDAFSSKKNNHATITVTYRYNDMDKLAFDILHELCHIEYHLEDGQSSFISMEGVEYSNDPREKEANDFARQSLISDEVWGQILKVGCKNLSPFKIVKTIAIEAEKHGKSPSIAISRYKHDTNWYQTSAYKSPKIH